MGLLESINKHNTPTRGVASVLIRLDAAQQNDLRAALDNPSIGHTAIVRGLKDHGVDVTEATVRRWRERSSSVDGL